MAGRTAPRRGRLDAEGVSEGVPVGMLETEGANDVEGSSETLGAEQADGALEPNGPSDGVKDGAVDVDRTSEGTPVGTLDAKGSVKTLSAAPMDGALDALGTSDSWAVGQSKTRGRFASWIVGLLVVLGAWEGRVAGRAVRLGASDGTSDGCCGCRRLSGGALVRRGACRRRQRHQRLA